MDKIHSLPREFFESPYFFLLDSSLGGRYTIAGWEPSRVIVCDTNDTGFFDRLEKELLQQPRVNTQDLGAAGGWIGYLGYELYSEIESKVPHRKPDLIPKAVFCYYDRFYVYDGYNTPSTLGALTPISPSYIKRGIPDSPPLRIPHKKGATSLRGGGGCYEPIESNFSRERYLQTIRAIKNYISAGDCYQVNLSQRFTAPVSQPSSLLYQRLRAVSPAPYSAFLNLGDAQILSSSPESFLSLDGTRVVTRPIKGTRPRGITPEADRDLRNELAESEKDRAELLMITDLERNDLGRVCRPGSVRVTELRHVETFPQVHHLVSTIEGEVREDCGLIDLLRATFPGGSITGAPKVRAMQIIRELEPHARDVYCGAIGFIGNNGQAQFNIAIRTMVVKNGNASFCSGGGIVADSDPEKEYDETLAKAKGIMETLKG